MPDEAEENFCKKMANATKQLHRRSDGLVEMKLLFGKDYREHCKDFLKGISIGDSI